MMEKKEFKTTFGDAMKAVGFVKKGQSWFKRGTDSTVVLNLQKSDFDDKYYVNFGVWLMALGAEQFPAVHKCHIQSRLTSLFPDRSEMIERACRLSGDAAEFSEFVDFLSREVGPFVDACLRMDGLREMLMAGNFKRALIMKEARQHLGDI